MHLYILEIILPYGTVYREFSAIDRLSLQLNTRWHHYLASLIETNVFETHVFIVSHSCLFSFYIKTIN